MHFLNNGLSKPKEKIRLGNEGGLWSRNEGGQIEANEAMTCDLCLCDLGYR